MSPLNVLETSMLFFSLPLQTCLRIIKFFNIRYWSWNYRGCWPLFCVGWKELLVLSHSLTLYRPFVYIYTFSSLAFPLATFVCLVCLFTTNTLLHTKGPNLAFALQALQQIGRVSSGVSTYLKQKKRKSDSLFFLPTPFRALRRSGHRLATGLTCSTYTHVCVEDLASPVPGCLAAIHLQQSRIVD